jgi:hypothetical protein
MESLFFFLLLYYYAFSFALQRWFLELEVALHNILNNSKWSTDDEDLKK